MHRSTRWLFVPLAMLGLVGAACGSSASKAAETTAATPVPALKGDITVFAAASLTEAFNEVGAAFTKANPEAKATFSYDASSALVAADHPGRPGRPLRLGRHRQHGQADARRPERHGAGDLRHQPAARSSWRRATRRGSPASPISPRRT